MGWGGGGGGVGERRNVEDACSRRAALHATQANPNNARVINCQKKVKQPYFTSITRDSNT